MANHGLRKSKVYLRMVKNSMLIMGLIKVLNASFLAQDARPMTIIAELKSPWRI